MSIFKKLIFAAILICATLTFHQGTPHAEDNKAQKVMKGFQKDADHVRLEHLIYWTGLFEEYKIKTGHYPLQNGLIGEKAGLVRIATKGQQIYFDKTMKLYDAANDSNADGNFQEFPIKLLVEELEHKLGRAIDEKYDIQKVPSSGPNYYNYFVTKDGYLMWVVCNTCGVTKISTLLVDDGNTPTVNIVSEGMAGKVTKALTRDEMMENPIFKEWLARPYDEERFVRLREMENLHNSKTYE